MAAIMQRPIYERGDIRGVRVVRSDDVIPLSALPTQDGEEWRYVRGRDDYAISSHGRLARTYASRNSWAGRILKGKTDANKKGHSYKLSAGAGHVRSLSAIRLVYEAFVAPVPDDMNVVIAANDGKIRPENLTLVHHHFSRREGISARLNFFVSAELYDWVERKGGVQFVRDVLLEAWEAEQHAAGKEEP